MNESGAIAHPAGYGENLRPGERAPAPYAASSIASRGRMHAEAECTTRSPFQRDRDRILHSTSFRRLTYKTQVFLFHEGDHFRSRLTHSLEVAQIARTIARQLRLDEDLAEALALAHDLGHSPFGHAGERALDIAMRHYGGFDHNAQSLRVVTALERKYMAFDGLNLTWETLEGLAKHNGPVSDKTHAVAKAVHRLDNWCSLRLNSWASGEAQAASLADDIAYLCHDLDDGLRAGLLSLQALRDVPVAGAFIISIGNKVEDSGNSSRTIYEVTRRMITTMVSDVVRESRARLTCIKPLSPDDIRQSGSAVVSFSTDMDRDLRALKSYLFSNVYRHPRVMRVMEAAEQIVRDLFMQYFAEPKTMPETWSTVALNLDDRRRARLVADFVSGQTDRYAIAEHQRLFAQTPELR